jgi:hypothetical protein
VHDPPLGERECGGLVDDDDDDDDSSSLGDQG